MLLRLPVNFRCFEGPSERTIIHGIAYHAREVRYFPRSKSGNDSLRVEANEATNTYTLMCQRTRRSKRHTQTQRGVYTCSFLFPSSFLLFLWLGPLLLLASRKREPRRPNALVFSFVLPRSLSVFCSCFSVSWSLTRSRCLLPSSFIRLSRLAEEGSKSSVKHLFLAFSHTRAGARERYREEQHGQLFSLSLLAMHSRNFSIYTYLSDSLAFFIVFLPSFFSSKDFLSIVSLRIVFLYPFVGIF